MDHRLLDHWGVMLLAVLGAVTFAMAAPSAGWGTDVAMVLQAGVLLLALRVSGSPPRLTRAGWVAAVVAVAIGPGGRALWDGGTTIAAALAVVLAAAAIAAIVQRLVRMGALTGRTVLGALCVYLLLGTLFAFAYATVASLRDGVFFGGGEAATLASLHYFSFTTLTTVGFGDLAPVGQVGRAMAVLEALLGQIYLVTVIALLVGNLRLPGRRPPD